MKQNLKKALSLLLAVCIAAVSVPLCAAGTEDPLRLLVAADTHFQCAADLGEPDGLYREYMLDPETFGYASTQGQMNYESEAILAALLGAFAASDAKYLLIAGDLTCGKRASHLAFAEHLRKAEAESGRQIFVTVGNHDCAAKSSDDRISMEEFREIYADFGYREALSRHDASASYAVDLDAQHRLLAIDSCIYGEDDGKLSVSVFRWLKEQVKKAKADGKTPVAMMHHSLLPHYELQPMLDNWRFYAGWFADHGVRTVLTGHIHANDISSMVSDRGNTVYDIQTGALIASPNTYRVLTMDQSGVQIESRFITKIDPSLLPDCLTDAQKAKLAEDFSGYAKDYYVSGVCKWLHRNLGSVNRLARWFKLKEGTKAYAAAERLTARLGAAVGQDIYDSGSGASVEAALAPYHIEVPQSAYKKPYEVAAKLMYGFFHGDEDAAGNEADTALLLTCLEGAILTAIQSEPDKAALRPLARALKVKTDLAAAASSLKTSVWARQLAERMALSLLETLAGGFVDDYSAPGDLNVTLTFGENRADAAPSHLFVQVLRLCAEYGKRMARGF